MNADLYRRMLKAKRPVLRPGSRGGHYRVTPDGDIRYDDASMPTATHPPVLQDATPDVDPSAIDAQLAEIYGRRGAAADRARQARDKLYALAGETRDKDTGFYDPRVTLDQVLERAPDPGLAFERETWDRTLAALTAARATIAETEKEAAPLEAVYQDRRWTRFFLVTSSLGHIHTSMHCKTCFPTTQYHWLTDMSGLTEADAVRAHGAKLCTVCFPTAPVEWTNFWEQKKAEENCTGTQPVPGSTRGSGGYSTKYGTCPECGDRIILKPNGMLRAHLTLDARWAKKPAVKLTKPEAALLPPDLAAALGAGTLGDRRPALAHLEAEQARVKAAQDELRATPDTTAPGSDERWARIRAEHDLEERARRVRKVYEKVRG